MAHNGSRLAPSLALWYRKMPASWSVTRLSLALFIFQACLSLVAAGSLEVGTPFKTTAFSLDLY